MKLPFGAALAKHRDEQCPNQLSEQSQSIAHAYE